ncbi:Hexadecenal dehydrogenase [Xanthoria calcicola]
MARDLASMASIATELRYTPVDSIPAIASGVRNAFNSHKTKPIGFRLTQLRKLYWGIKDNEAAIVQACKEDLGKPVFETYLSEIDWCTNDIIFVTQNLQKWMKDEKAPDIPLANKLLSPKIRKDPLGAILIIGTYNFPLNLCLTPLVGAIAAGCTAVLKPSESAPSVAKILQHIVETSIDASCYTVVQGAVPETTALLEEKWDKIFYTGSAHVAKIIAKKAAETLTPMTLELGGRNPAIVTKNANVRLAAKRLLWGKTLHSRQVCISQNYIMVDKEVLDPFIAEMKLALKQFYPDGAKESDDFGRIVHGKQWSRLKQMLESTRGRIVMGGDMDESQRYMGPTVIIVDSPSDPLVAEESFGPLIPILPVEDLDTAIRIAGEVHRTPLGLYPFGNKQETDRMMTETQSGGVSVNDALFHGSLSTLPFGGVGDSGHGAYRGKSSFDCFSHRRSVTSTPGWMEGLLDVRYPPYEGKLAKFKKMSELKPNFDRDGKVKFSLWSYMLSLGTGSKTRGLIGYTVILLAAFSTRQYLDNSAR